MTIPKANFQKKPKDEAKVLSCLTGSIFNIVLDLRPDSPTFTKWESFELKASARMSLHVPEGCANAWMTLEDNTTLIYYHSEFFSPGFEGGIRYNDPYFNFNLYRS